MKKFFIIIFCVFAFNANAKETTFDKTLFENAQKEGKIVVVSSWTKYCTSCASQIKILDKAKNDLLSKYDNIFIDCPPSLSLLTIMALVASDELLVPLQTEFFALEGITQLVKTIDRIKVNLNPDLKVRGILLTMFDKRNKLSSQVDKEARNYFKEKVYKTVIPRNVRLSEAPSHGLPCVIYDKTCLGSKSYLKLAREFLVKKNFDVESAA